MGSLRATYILGTFLLSALVVIPYQSFALRFKTRGYKNIPERYQRVRAGRFGIRGTIIGEPVQERGGFVALFLEIAIDAAQGHGGKFAKNLRVVRAPDGHFLRPAAAGVEAEAHDGKGVLVVDGKEPHRAR